MKYFIQTFGCQQNVADSQRLAGYYQARGYTQAKTILAADVVIINSCVVRQQAEDRVYGLVKNLKSNKNKRKRLKIVVTGCLVGAANREPSGQRLKKLRQMLPTVDEFLPIEEVGFANPVIRNDKTHALVPISNGCNNFCTYCIVPFSRGPETSRPFQDIIEEIRQLTDQGYKEITLVGQNVNSYGADLIKNQSVYQLPDGTKVKPVVVKHLGKKRIPTLFPHLLNEICKIKKLKKISFVSSNPWDFSAELIEVIAKNPQIDRLIHLPVQSGDDEILKKMNRWYSRNEYLTLTKKIRKKIKGVKFTTDIIVGFPAETKKAFQHTCQLAKKVSFDRAFIACYSPRIGTAAAKKFKDNVSHQEKMTRFHTLDKLINFRYRHDK